MKENSFERITGMANLVYSITLLIVGILFYLLLPVNKIATDYSLLIRQPGWIPLNILSMAAVIIGVLGLLGIYIKQMKESGFLLLIGLIITISALIMKASALSWEFIAWPMILKDNPSSSLLTESLIYKDTGILSFYGILTMLFSTGNILIGISGLKTKIFPKWSSILIIAGGPAYAILLSVPPFGIIGLVLYAAGISGYGLFLYQSKAGGIK